MLFSYHTGAQSSTFISIQEAKFGELGTTQLELQPLSVTDPQPRLPLSVSSAAGFAWLPSGWEEEGVRADQSPQKMVSSLTYSLLVPTL